MTMLLARLVHYGFGLYNLGLLAYVLCTWFAHPAADGLRSWLSRWYEPLLAPIRRWIPSPQFGCTAVDLSPLVLYIGLGLLKSAILSLLVPPF
ncbi:YggT family protein [Pontiella desulfatans]|nr:YggT family protein [Pontiella desulfatans]